MTISDPDPAQLIRIQTDPDPAKLFRIKTVQQQTNKQIKTHLESEGCASLSRYNNRGIDKRCLLYYEKKKKKKELTFASSIFLRLPL